MSVYSMSRIGAHVILALWLSGISLAAWASTEFQIPDEDEAARVNDRTIGVVFTHEELYHQAVHNMEDELEPIGGLRIVPIMGKNHVQSLYDLLYLKGVDLALVRADALEYVSRKTDNEVIAKVVRTVTRISSEKIAIFARNDIASVEELAGKKIGLGLEGSGEFVTGSVVMDVLGIEAEFEHINSRDAAQLLRHGELDAMVYLLRTEDAVMGSDDAEAAKHVRNLKTIDDLHLLALPDNEQLRGIYTRAKLDAEDLPGMLTEGRSIDTYAVDAILAAYKWRSDNPRHARVERFVNAFTTGLEGLQTGPYEPIWSRVSLDAVTPGVERLDLVDQALAVREAEAMAAEQKALAEREERAAEQRAAKIAVLEEQKNAINQTLSERLGDADTQELEALLEQLNGFMAELDAKDKSAGEAAAAN